MLGAIGGWALAFLLYDLFLYKIGSSQVLLCVKLVDFVGDCRDSRHHLRCDCAVHLRAHDDNIDGAYRVVPGEQVVEQEGESPSSNGTKHKSS